MSTPSLRDIFLLLSALVLPALAAGLQSSFTVASEVAVTYDDNILRYSDQDIDDFVNNRRPYRYAIETYDDLITRLSASVFWRVPLFAGQTRVRLKYIQNHYAINKIKDYETISLHLRQRWAENEIQVGYIYLPRYYSRHLPDSDVGSGSESYRPFDFERHQFSLKMSRPLFRSTSAELRLGYRHYDYNGHFDEYDMEMFSVEPRLRQKIGPAGFSLQYEFRIAQAKGYDDEGESRANSDDSDASYDLHGVGGELELKMGRPLVASLACNYHRKYFVTAKSVVEDPYHFDREDTYFRLAPAVAVLLPHRLKLEFHYAYTRRDAFSPVEADIEDIKDYTCNRFGVRLVADSLF